MFGGSGAIGSAIVDAASAAGWSVVATTRRPRSDGPAAREGLHWRVVDPFAANFSLDDLRVAAPFDGVCWAQGANGNDSIYDVDLAAHEAMYRANVVYVLATLQRLLADGL